MSALVAELLTFSKAGMQPAEVQRVPVGVAETARRAVARESRPGARSCRSCHRRNASGPGRSGLSFPVSFQFDSQQLALRRRDAARFTSPPVTKATAWSSRLPTTARDCRKKHSKKYSRRFIVRSWRERAKPEARASVSRSSNRASRRAAEQSAAATASRTGWPSISGSRPRSDCGSAFLLGCTAPGRTPVPP